MRLLLGECLDHLPGLPDASVDAVVADPPAGIGFMGQAWDSPKGARKAWKDGLAEIFAECLRVLKPGGHALVWALPRTSHWTGETLEQAGFELRDVITHHFGNGFPKSLNIGEGRGTGLKPATEFWWLCRKPLGEGNVAANVSKHGTGALNIDACRVPGSWATRAGLKQDIRGGRFISCGRELRRMDLGRPQACDPLGRWPANLILSHSPDCGEECAEGCPVRLLGETRGPEEDTASRFFMVFHPKAPRSERNAGLEGFARSEAPVAVERHATNITGKPCIRVPRANTHPTVKAVGLMRYLSRLITPPGGTVLDPFMGSGSTGVACIREGFGFIGIEREPEYFAIAEARIRHAQDGTQGQLLKGGVTA